MGALRSGAGLVTLAAPENVIRSVASRILEAIFLPLPEEDADGIRLTGKEGCHFAPAAACEKPLAAACEKTTVSVAGCGKTESPQTAAEMGIVLRHTSGTVILDAGGLCSLAAWPDFARAGSDTANAVSLETLLRPLAGRLILTPHPGEMARITGLPVPQILQMPADTAREFAARTGAVVVLKGHRTLIAAPDGQLYENRTGNAGLARGGSGDVLAGMIAGLAAQGLSPLEAAVCGVWLHGTAADRCARRLSMQGMLPEDILADLQTLFREAGR